LLRCWQRPVLWLESDWRSVGLRAFQVFRRRQLELLNAPEVDREQMPFVAREWCALRSYLRQHLAILREMRPAVGMVRELQPFRGGDADSSETDLRRASRVLDHHVPQQTLCMGEVGEVDVVAEAVGPALELHHEQLAVLALGFEEHDISVRLDQRGVAWGESAR
jgi:hypothetical protein